MTVNYRYNSLEDFLATNPLSVDAQIDDLIAEVGAGDQNVPPKAPRLPELRGDLRFVSPALCRSDVEEWAEL